MKVLSPLFIIPLLAISSLLSSCSSSPSAAPAAATQTADGKPVFVNPHPAGTYDHFKAEPSYKSTMNTWKNEALLSKANSSNTKVIVYLSLQRGVLKVNDEVAMDYRVSSGRSTHRTPTGNYKITEKMVEKRSNIYGTIYNADGKSVKSAIDIRKNEVPEGGNFVGTSMPYWMRLTSDGIGLHRGAVGRRFASGGCVRVHSSAVTTIYSKVGIGTPVSIVP